MNTIKYYFLHGSKESWLHNKIYATNVVYDLSTINTCVYSRELIYIEDETTKCKFYGFLHDLCPIAWLKIDYDVESEIEESFGRGTIISCLGMFTFEFLVP